MIKITKQAWVTSPPPVAEGEMPKKILIADDNPLIREALCRLFETQKGYDICAEASNGQEAIALALKFRPELIILDFSMPVLNGLEAARELKKLMPNVPIILFTQHANVVNALLDNEMTVDRTVSKTDAIELMGYVKSLLPV